MDLRQLPQSGRELGLEFGRAAGMALRENIKGFNVPESVDVLSFPCQACEAGLVTVEKGLNVSGERDVIHVCFDGGEGDIPEAVRSDAVPCVMDDEGRISREGGGMRQDILENGQLLVPWRPMKELSERCGQS